MSERGTLRIVVEGDDAKRFHEGLTGFVEMAKENPECRLEDPEGEYAYEVNISNEELARFAEGEKYVTSTDDLKSLITAYNQMLPMDYFEGCQLMSCSLSKDGKTLRYKLQLFDMDMGSLAGVTSQSLKDYMMDMLPYMTDAPGVIARENDLKLSFDFTADCSDWWSSRVVIKPEEYKDLQITE